MYDNLKVFHAAHSMALHAGVKQSVVSTNIANADTPKYQARQVAPFSLESGNAGNGFVARATRQGHLAQPSSGPAPRIVADESAPNSPNENNVVIELEMLKAVEAKRQHDRALSIYRHTMSVIRTSLGRG